MPRFANYQVDLRPASSTSIPFPYRDQSVTLLHISASGVITKASTLSEKRSMVQAVAGKDVVLAAFPGQSRQDVFIVDDLTAARAALG
jgi:hypothetical protein